MSIYIYIHVTYNTYVYAKKQVYIDLEYTSTSFPNEMTALVRTTLVPRCSCCLKSSWYPVRSPSLCLPLCFPWRTVLGTAWAWWSWRRTNTTTQPTTTTQQCSNTHGKTPSITHNAKCSQKPQRMPKHLSCQSILVVPKRIRLWIETNHIHKQISAFTPCN